MRRSVMTVVVVGAVVVVGGVIFAAGGGGDRRASIGGSAETADKAAPERPAGKPIEIPAGQARADQANRVVEALGAQRSAGAYFDSEADAMIVTVVDDAAGAAVRSTGGRAKLVDNSAAKLAATEKALRPDVEIAGVAYGVDVANNTVLVTVDGSVSHADRNKIKAAVQAKSDAATLEEISGEIKLLNYAFGECSLHQEQEEGYKDCGYPVSGEKIFKGTDSPTTGGCTRGFNVVGPTLPYGGYLSAGHCDGLFVTWESASLWKTAQTVQRSFPTNDYALMKYTKLGPTETVSALDGAYLWGTSCSPCATLIWPEDQPPRQLVTSAGEAYVGQLVKKSGYMTRVTSGTVTGVNQTVMVQGRAVDGMIRTTACAAFGDSGGPLWSGSVALGITSSAAKSADGSCISYYQNVREALAAYNVRIRDCGRWTRELGDCGVSINKCAATNEGNSGTPLATVTVTRTGPAVADASRGDVGWKTYSPPPGGDVATPTTDYLTRTGTLHFASGETQKQIQIPVVGDAVKEQNEFFEVRLTSAPGDRILSPAYTRCYITNDD